MFELKKKTRTYTHTRVGVPEEAKRMRRNTMVAHRRTVVRGRKHGAHSFREKRVDAKFHAKFHTRGGPARTRVFMRALSSFVTTANLRNAAPMSGSCSFRAASPSLSNALPRYTSLSTCAANREKSIHTRRRFISPSKFPAIEQFYKPNEIFQTVASARVIPTVESSARSSLRARDDPCIANYSRARALCSDREIAP